MFLSIPTLRIARTLTKMNYLAHILLSGSNVDVQLGNFMGDAVKGKKYLNYTRDLQNGLLLHRQIDSFTDFHKTVRQSKKRLAPIYGHYSGVLIDIFYDYFLSVNWDSFSDQPLDEFISNFYTMVTYNMDKLPKKTQAIVPIMLKQNWLYKYSYYEGLERVLIGMKKKIKHDIPLDLGIHDLKKHEKELNADFMLFFPQLVQYSKETLEKLEQ